MKKTTSLIILPVLLSLFFYAGCFKIDANVKNLPILITDIKIATDIDENLLPVKIIDVLPKDSSKVTCWFKWRNAKVNTMILARWKFVTDDIPILDNAVAITRKEGMGGLSLVMPERKTLPSGIYRIDLTLEGQTLKSLAFKVE